MRQLLNSPHQLVSKVPPEREKRTQHSRRYKCLSWTMAPRKTAQTGTKMNGKANTKGTLNYKPVPLRWLYLSVLFLSICTFVGLLQGARRLLPVTDGPGSAPEEVPINLPTLQGRVAAPNRAPIPTSASASASTTTPANTDDAPRKWAFPLSNQTSLNNSSYPMLVDIDEFYGRGNTSSKLRQILRVDPSQYAEIRGEPPLVRLVARCLWEPGPPGQQPVNPDDDMRTDVPSDFQQCWYGSVRQWYSDGPPDCVYQFADPFLLDESKMGSRPWGPNTWYKDGWNLMGLLLGEACATLDRCRKKCPMDPDIDRARGGPYYDRRVYTTVFQVVVGSVVTTTRVGSSDVPVTVGATTYRVTATQAPGESIWIPIASSISPAAPSRSGLEQPGATSFTTFTRPKGQPTATAGAYLVTLIGTNGVPTTIAAYDQTLVDSNGLLTTRTGYSLPAGTAPLPPPHQTNPPTPNLPRPRKQVYVVSEGTYFIGLFLPTLLTTILSIPVQILDTNIKLMLPFFALARHGPKGATARDSLCLAPCKVTAPLHSLRCLFKFGELVPILSDLLVLSAAVLTSVASEAVGFRLSGQCTVDRLRGCIMSVWIFEAPFLVAEGLLLFMAVLVLGLGVLLRRMRSGVAVDPWNVGVVASLLGDEWMRGILSAIEPTREGGRIGNEEVVKLLEGKSFSLGWSRLRGSDTRYGIIPTDNDSDHSDTNKTGRFQSRRARSMASNFRTLDGGIQSIENTKKRVTESLPRGFTKRTWNHLADIGFFLLVCGFFILILYYETTTLDTPFERFFDNQGFGIRFIFAGLGAVISLVWEGIFSRMFLSSSSLTSHEVSLY